MKDVTDYNLGREQIDEARYRELLKHIRLHATEKYEFPPQIMQVDGITIATLGNFSASTGKPKSKKTFNISAIVASALSGEEVLKFKVTLPEGRKRILYVDTEQNKYHCHKVLHRILRLAGLPTDSDCEQIEFLVLREYSPVQRRDIIRFALRDLNDIGLVVIDGIRDLMYDINSPTESLEVINELMRWSSYYNLHVHTVLHQNKGDDNTRGHIGTELNNKAETILQVSRNTEDPSVSEVRATHIRDKEFSPFAFSVGDDALPYLVEEYDSNTKRKVRTFSDLTEEQHRLALDNSFKDKSVIKGYNELIEALKVGYTSVGFQRGTNTLVKLCKYLSSQNVIFKNSEGYGFNRAFVLQKEL